MGNGSDSSRCMPLVCVIGAGSSGIAAAKQLHAAGLPFECFEKANAIGGLWNFGHNAGHHAAYRSLHINTSKQVMEFSDFPMPDDYPDYPSHYEIADYFDSYVDHFGFRDKITLGVAVEKAVRRDDGVWMIQLSSGEVREFDALVVANGHHWDPRWPEPEFPGEFAGRQMHAHDYVDTEGFEGKNVVVVGMGNSAMDIAVETSGVADKVYLSARNGVHVVPKYAFGRPFDHLEPPVALPWAIKKHIFATVLRLAAGRVEDYGLPKPNHRPGEAHPTVSSDILHKVGSGIVKVRPNIARLCGDSVEFTDGTVERVDVIVYCTGYIVKFPFFDENFISAPDNDLPLFHRVFKPDIDNVFFVGLLQPLGAIMPLAEIQSRWVTEYLRGHTALPARNEMLAQMAGERRRMFKRYVSSKRHTMQVDFREYLRAIEREIDEGAKRVVERSLRPPIEPRARRQEPAPSSS